MDGRRPITVTAITQRLQPEVYLRVDDEATIILTYADAQAIIQASWNWPFDRKDMEIYGESGYAITVGRDNFRMRQHGADETSIAAAPLTPPHDAPLSLLRAVIRDGVQPDGLSSLETNLLVTEILDAARRSAAAGKTISMAPR
jgi:predicted dehydrogenase